jgi:hypothetical protein
MRFTIARAVLAAAIALCAAPGGTAADPPLAIDGYRISPREPVLDANGPTVVTVRVSARGAAAVSVTAVPAVGGIPRRYVGLRQGGDLVTQVWDATIIFDTYAPFGTWNLEITAWDGDATALRRTAVLTIKRRTRIDRFRAHPDIVRPGHTLYVSGQLLRLDAYAFRSSQFLPYQGQDVSLYFSPELRHGVRTFHFVDTTRTDAIGWFHFRLSPDREGTWMVRFAGSPGYAPATSAADYVNLG